MMKGRFTRIALALAGFGLMAACGGSAEVQVRTPTQPVIVPTAQVTCGETWVHMPMVINFPTSAAEIDSQNRMILQEMVRSAQTRSDIRRVRVEGHTDTCGGELNNMVLSNNRAVSVANELVTMGVPREMIDTVGYGSTQPRANEQCGRRQELSAQTNRRVEFSLLVCR